MFPDYSGIDLEIKDSKICRKLSNIWTSTTSKQSTLREEITMKSRKYFRLNGNERTTYDNLWDAVKAVL